VRRGAVWWADLGDPWGQRPVVLIARDAAYTTLSWVMVAPTTTRIRTAPSLVLLEPGSDPVPKPCIVHLDHVQAIRREWLVEPLGDLSPERMAEIDRALHFALGLRD
jgi:mRNA interferase MazF